MLARRFVFPLCLLVGPLLVIVAGTLHPDLVGDGAAQLTTIARCRAWRAIHWTFLFSFPLALTGLVGVARMHAGSTGENAVRAGMIVGTFAYSAWTVIVAFMAGAGWSLAQAFTLADPGMTATRAVFLFDMVHPFALATQRVAAFALVFREDTKADQAAFVLPVLWQLVTGMVLVWEERRVPGASASVAP